MDPSNMYKIQHFDKKQLTYTTLNLKLINDIITQGEPFKINQEQIEILEFVCRISEYIETQNVIRVRFQDNDNYLEGVVYTKGDSSVPRAVKGYDYIPNGYVQVLGTIRTFSDHTKCVVQSINNVKSYGQVHYHKMKVL